MKKSEEVEIWRSFDSDLVEEIIATRSFQTNMHLLANTLHIKDVDATVELLEWLICKRWKSKTEDEVARLLHEEDKVLLNSMGWARKDIIRNWSLAKKNQQQIREKLKVGYEIEALANIHGSGSGQELPSEEDVIDRLKIAGFRHKTIDWVSFLIEYGEEETLEKYGITKRQLQRWIYNFEEKIGKKDLGGQVKKMELEERLALVDEFIKTIETAEEMEKELVKLIKDNEEFVEELVDGIKEIKQKALMVRNFVECENKEQYAFVNAIYDLKDKIESELKKIG